MERRGRSGKHKKFALIMTEVVVEGSDCVINAFLNHSYHNLNSCGLTLVSTNQHYQAKTYQDGASHLDLGH